MLKTILSVGLLSLGILLCSCGYKYQLPGHSQRTRAEVTMRVGEKRPALGEGFLPLKFGRQLSLSSEDPSIVDVEFRNRDPEHADIWLVARAPGTTTVHYGDLYNQTLPFADTETQRLGVKLPVIPEELRRGSGTGWQREVWLRRYSEGAFRVTVLPPRQ